MKYLIVILLIFSLWSHNVFSGVPVSNKIPIDITSTQTPNNTQTLVLWNRNYEAEYMRAAILNILNLSVDKFGEFQLVSSTKLEQKRAFAEMANDGAVDIFVGGVDKRRENQATLILAPIDRGLLGLRVCLIPIASTKFQAISSLSKLRQRQIVFGTGSIWPDKNVFAKAGLKTVVSPTYKNLFRMLSAGRFDCFARSIAEVGIELEQHYAEPIRLEGKLLLSYPFAEFIFVSHSSEKLAERLKFGFAEAVKNRSFYTLFDKYHRTTLESYQVSQRKLLALDNADMSHHARRAIKEYGVEGFFVEAQTHNSQAPFQASEPK